MPKSLAEEIANLLDLSEGNKQTISSFVQGIQQLSEFSAQLATAIGTWVASIPPEARQQFIQSMEKYAALNELGIDNVLYIFVLRILYKDNDEKAIYAWEALSYCHTYNLPLPTWAIKHVASRAPHITTINTDKGKFTSSVKRALGLNRTSFMHLKRLPKMLDARNSVKTKIKEERISKTRSLNEVADQYDIPYSSLQKFYSQIEKHMSKSQSLSNPFDDD